jgi:hypothetical protein
MRKEQFNNKREEGGQFMIIVFQNIQILPYQCFEDLSLPYYQKRAMRVEVESKTTVNTNVGKQSKRKSQLRRESRYGRDR